MKLALIFMFLVVSTLIQVMLAFVFHYTIKHHFHEQDYQLIHEKFALLAKHKKNIPTLDTETLNTSELSTLSIWHINQQRITYTNSRIALPINQLPSRLAKQQNPYTLEWMEGNNHYRAFTFFINDETSWVIGININHHMHFLITLNMLLIGSIIMTSLLSGLFGIVIVNKGLRPLKRFGDSIPSPLNSDFVWVNPPQYWNSLHPFIKINKLRAFWEYFKYLLSIAELMILGFQVKNTDVT